MANISDLFRQVLPRPPVDVNPLPEFKDFPNSEFSDKGAGIVMRSLLQQLQSLPSSAPEGVKPRSNLDIFSFDQDPRSEITPQQQGQRELFQYLNGLQI